MHVLTIRPSLYNTQEKQCGMYVLTIRPYIQHTGETTQYVCTYNQALYTTNAQERQYSMYQSSKLSTSPMTEASKTDIVQPKIINVHCLVGQFRQEIIRRVQTCRNSKISVRHLV
jgi:hypothetical protein